MNVSDAASKLLAAVAVTRNVPSVFGVPPIKPLAGSIAMPGGSPLAVYVRPSAKVALTRSCTVVGAPTALVTSPGFDKTSGAPPNRPATSGDKGPTSPPGAYAATAK